jgi:hypothetical protein
MMRLLEVFLKTADYFEARAKRANKEAFEGVLKRVDKEKPRKGDEFP